MSRRTQITLTEEQYARLSALSEESGLSMSELVRRALDRTYAAGGLQVLAESFGAWAGRRASGEKYVERRRKGMADRLADLERARGRAR